MFKNNKLKELQNVQEEIRKMELEKPKPPDVMFDRTKPTEYKKLKYFCFNLEQSLLNANNNYNDNSILPSRLYSSYIVRTIGDFLIQLANFYDNKDEWQIKMDSLIEKENHLKRKLGI